MLFSWFSRPSHLICIGAQKSGTSWLYANLARHPAFCAPRRKELNHFYQDTGVPYERHFTNRRHFQIRLDVSPNYAAFDNIARKIHDQCPNARIVYILRDPVERALSQYPMAVSRGNIPPGVSFREAFRNDLQAIRTQGIYVKRIDEYLEFFTINKSFMVIPYDQLEKDPHGFLKAVLDFCGTSGVFDSPLLHERVWQTPRREGIDAGLYPELREFYAPWNRELARKGFLDPQSTEWLNT